MKCYEGFSLHKAFIPTVYWFIKPWTVKTLHSRFIKFTTVLDLKLASVDCVSFYKAKGQNIGEASWSPSLYFMQLLWRPFEVIMKPLWIFMKQLWSYYRIPSYSPHNISWRLTVLKDLVRINRRTIWFFV